MSAKDKCNRRRFLAAAATAVAAPAVITRVARAQGKLAVVPDDDIKKITDALPEKATVKPAKPRKMLVIWRCDGFFHGSIAWGNKALELMGKKTGAYETVVTDDMAAFDPGKLDQFDAVMFNNTTRLNFKDPKRPEALTERRETLMAFVKGGRGVCGIHAATDNFYDWPEAAAMMGGLFVSHPWGGGGTWAFQVEEPDHPINKGFGGKGFWVKDEIYKMKDPYSREKLRVLLGLDMTKKVNLPGSREDKDNAVAWIRRFGKGRVFYCSLGHNNQIFWTPQILQHYLDGIQYAMGDLKADDTPSAKLSKRPKIVPAPKEVKTL
ncbi:MAG: ThuA domain-containing protein [Planctomycetota bacterium]